MPRIEVRLKRLERAAAARGDPYGDAVRGRGDAGVRELERVKQRQREVDPVGAEILRRREPMIPPHPTLAALDAAREANRTSEPEPAASADPVGDEIRRKRGPVARPLGVSARRGR